MGDMYSFLLNMWIMGKLTEEQVQNAIAKGYITQEQADTILVTPKC